MEADKLIFQGEVQNIFFENKETMYKVLSVKLLEYDFDYYEDEITVTGIFGDVQVGSIYQFEGHFVNHPKYGEQFQCDNYKQMQPQTEDSIISYLSSDKFPGIGKKTAENIIAYLGLDALQLINDDPEVLAEIPGLNYKKKRTIVEVIQSSFGMENAVLKLLEYGFSNYLAFQIYQKYQAKTLEIITENPYQLIYDFQTIGFNKADHIALQIGIASNNLERLKASVIETLNKNCYSTGNTYMLLTDVLKRAKYLLEETRPEQIEFDDLGEAIIALREQKLIHNEEEKIYLYYLYEAESSIVKNTKRLLNYNQKQYQQQDLEKAIQETEASYQIQYDSSQKEAIINALNSPMYLLTGGPGTGKTTIINGIVRVYAKLNDYSLDIADYKDASKFPIHLAAPTGRAAKRMGEATGLNAMTIHRLLGLGRDEEVQATTVNIEQGLLIIDEMSMVDTQLAARILEAVNLGVQVIFVGDKDQLPSVGPGQVLYDMLAVEVIPQTELTKIYRQSADSTIVDLAYQVRDGNFANDFTKNYADRSYFSSDVKNIEPMIKKIVESAKNKGYSPQDIQVLAPMYKGLAGIDKLNEMMQELFNPAHPKKHEVKYQQRVFRVGDKVLHLVNDPEENIFNGDMGVIVGVIPAEEAESQTDELIIEFDQTEVIYPRSDWHKITLSYCCSIHKAQGSEFEVVILPMVSQYSKKMLRRNLLYTAITRSKAKLILLGEIDVFKYCVETTGDIRKTSLQTRFQVAFGEDKEVEVNKIDDKQYLLTLDLIKEQAIPWDIGINNITPYDFIDKKETFD